MTKTKKPNRFWLKNKQMLCTALATINLLLGFNYGVVAQNASYNANSVPISGGYSCAFGFEALKSNTGGWNTANGYQALSSNTYGVYNTANGYRALYFNTSGGYNTANGASALYYNTTGYTNTANGYAALFSNTTGNNNTALGYFADVASGNLNYATAIGTYAKVSESNTIQLGNDSVTKVYAGVGKNATLIAGGLQITSGTPAVGKVLTSDANGIASWQTPMAGGGSGWGLTGNAGTVDGTHFIGTTDNVPLNIKVNNQKAGRIDPTLLNTSYGYQSLYFNTTGTENTASGSNALYSNTTGDGNTATGSNALYTNTGGFDNTASGYFALRRNTKGSGNTANGSSTLIFNTDGNYNTASGTSALYNNTTGSWNTASGYRSLYSNTTSKYNVAVGAFALEENSKGEYNVAVGYNTSRYGTTLTNTTAVGAEAKAVGKSSTAIGAAAQAMSENSTAIGLFAVVNTRDKIRLGNEFVTEVETQFKYTTVSDGRFKNNVKEEDIKGLEFIKKLHPVAYNFDTRKFQEHITQNIPAALRNQYMNQDFSASTAVRRSGFIAQEVEKAAEEVGYDFDGVSKPQGASGNYSLAYSQFVVPLVKGMQEQQIQIEQLQQQINELKKLIAENATLTKGAITKEVENTNAEQISLYPNPTTGIFTFTTSHINNGTVEICDMEGNSLQKTTFNNATAGYRLNMSGYAKGVYLLNIIANGKKYTKRLVVQ